LTDTDEPDVTVEEQPVKKTAKSSKKAVSPDSLDTEVWVSAAYEATGFPPEVVRAALSLEGEGPYNRDQVLNAIKKFMQRPVKQEG